MNDQQLAALIFKAAKDSGEYTTLAIGAEYLQNNRGPLLTVREPSIDVSGAVFPANYLLPLVREIFNKTEVCFATEATLVPFMDQGRPHILINRVETMGHTTSIHALSQAVVEHNDRPDPEEIMRQTVKDLMLDAMHNPANAEANAEKVLKLIKENKNGK